MSFSSSENFQSNDILATITSAFDIKANYEDKRESNGVSTVSLSSDVLSRPHHLPIRPVPNVFGCDGDPSGSCCLDDVHRNSFCKEASFSPTNPKLYQHHVSTQRAAPEALMLHPVPSHVSSFSNPETCQFWNDPSNGQYDTSLRNNTCIRDNRRKDISKEQQIEKLRYTQTLNFLKRTGLYDLTMRLAGLLQSNSMLQAEIDSLRSENTNGFSFPPKY